MYIYTHTYIYIYIYTYYTEAWPARPTRSRAAAAQVPPRRAGGTGRTGALVRSIEIIVVILDSNINSKSHTSNSKHIHHNNVDNT